ncbi:MAG: VWA domain-containing protein [bacterium]|nr:VWA domain-containing protein [bacterium]
MRTQNYKRTKKRGVRWWMAMLGVVGLTLTNAHAAGLLIADGGFGGVLEIEEHDVHVTVNNGIAVTRVTQVFRNTEQRQVEALYTFPVPKGASVANFSMWINGKEMVGEVVEKERAREIYNSYKRQRRDPGLLEQTNYKTFEMRIFPIGPEAEQRVQIAYYQELDYDNDWATYVYPLATVTRRDLDSRTRGRFALTLDVMSEVPVVAVKSPSHQDEFLVARHSDNYYQASLETSGGDLNRDVVLVFQTARARTGLDLVVSRESGEDGFFQLTITAGDELSELAKGMDYLFILDVSGSMGEDGKLSLSRNSVGAFIGALGEADRFEVVSFNVTAETLFRRLREADSGARDEALAFLESRRARGGTILQPALELAYQYKDLDRPLNVVILSDGMTEQNERATLLRMIGSRPAATRVFCIGVGNEVNRPLLSQIAEDAGGLAAFISRGDDFERQAQAFRRKLMRPAATNLAIEIEDAGVYDLEPEKLPSLFHGSPLRIYGRYRDAGTARVHVRADVGGEMLDQWSELDFPRQEPANPEIERMWAWHRVQRLLREADRRGSRDDVLDEIVRLGEGFSIVTEYTSFLVLENDAEYQRWKIERRNALRIERDRRQQRRLREKLEELRRDATMALGPVQEGEMKQEEEVKQASAKPAPTPRPQPQTASRPRPATAPSAPRRSFDLGGGALDPSSAILAVALACLGFAAYRCRP